MQVNAPNVFTTGKIAKLCSVSIRTVARWIESDHLKAYRLPGDSTEYRVTKADLLAFLKEYGLPYEHVEGDRTIHVILLDAAAANVKAMETSLTHVEANCILNLAQDIISGSISLGLLKPQLLVIDPDQFDQGDLLHLLELARANEALKKTQVVILSDADTSAKVTAKFEKLGAVTLLKKPISTQNLSKKVVALLKAE